MTTALKISGTDAEKFLQGQVTCDVNGIELNQSQFAALCNRKGRVIASFLLEKHENFYIIEAGSDEIIDIIMARLQKYAQFYNDNNLMLEKINQDRFINENNNYKYLPVSESELFTPHKLKYNEIKGCISFTKGCYTGQEIIARVEYRSKKKS